MRDREREISELRAELFRRQQETGTQTTRVQQVQEQVADLRTTVAAEYQRGLTEGRATARQEAEQEISGLRDDIFRRQREAETLDARIQQLHDHVADTRITVAAEYQRGLTEGRAAARQEAETAMAPLQAVARQAGTEDGRRQAHAEYGIACTPFRCLEESMLGWRKTWRVGYTMQMTLRGIPIFRPLDIELERQSTYDEDRLLAVVRTVVDAAVKAGMQNVSLGEPVVKNLLDRVIHT
jgi:hypothetical protein